MFLNHIFFCVAGDNLSSYSEEELEQYFIEKIQQQNSLNGYDVSISSIESSIEIPIIDSAYSNKQTMVTLTTNGLSLFMQAVARNFNIGEAMGISAIGYMFTTPISVVMHWGNPNMNCVEKGIMTGYEVAAAGGGMLWTYAVANCWNITGWGRLEWHWYRPGLHLQ